MLKSIHSSLIFYAFWFKKSRKKWGKTPLTA
nr:MAG TPA: hypothetical protein [Caudoviricetes sp.]